ncbi:chorismate synthase [Aquisalinus flavus]|uniref:Chorismate synthase n=1 Tax=Aquisalinus flavus TaxID=1526572 RepID=A0A8J2V5R1_9PROT|nr:chorismate synthase [Aquisalinus flavus]MBD0426183.1 chorismate synthase [Aquisalinus flavus]UNE48243.1 chorismate synthase [Aquisalinus flavus]GGD09919.1 chorismate synthase [Aquisalinus flavus]
MSDNTFGKLFRVTTWGESHGPAIGCVIDGCPPGMRLTPEMIQSALDTRKPGTSKYVTQRKEPDEVRILSGVFEDDRTGGPVTTGTPICLMIENVDQRSKDYSDIRDKYRPGHADYTYEAKYGVRDYRGGGRSSARETASRVAAGAVAARVLDRLFDGAVKIRAGMVQMGPHKVDRQRIDWDSVGDNPFWCPDPVAAQEWEAILDQARKDGSSMGAMIEVVAQGVPPGLGAPVYGKLDTELAAAMMSINAVKGVEIGEGMNAAALSGIDNADEMRAGNRADNANRPRFLSNHAGGILGGISSGQDIVVRFAVKPTSSILTPRQTVTRTGEETEIVTKGRHDPCVGIRAVPVGIAMMACTLADHALRHRGQCG